MKLEHGIDWWRVVSATDVCVQNQADVFLFALDAKHDILELHDEVERLRILLAHAACRLDRTHEALHGSSGKLESAITALHNVLDALQK